MNKREGEKLQVLIENYIKQNIPHNELIKLVIKHVGEGVYE